MRRLFIGLDLPADLKWSLSGLRHSIKDARWVVMEDYHLTLQFLGVLNETKEHEVLQQLSTITWSPIQLNVRSVDFFGSKSQPRNLWAGVSPNAELTQLYNQILKALQPLELDLDIRTFRPHITLARLPKSSARQVGEFLQKFSLFSYPTFEITAFHLFQSSLKSKQGKYSILDTFTAADTNKSGPEKNTNLNDET